MDGQNLRERMKDREESGKSKEKKLSGDKQGGREKETKGKKRSKNNPK